jgi:hypothetical protein
MCFTDVSSKHMSLGAQLCANADRVKHGHFEAMTSCSSFSSLRNHHTGQAVDCVHDVVQPDYCASGHFRLSVFR